jgi:MFS family permease
MLLADRGQPTWANVAFLVLPGLIGGSGGILQFIAMNSIRQAITPEHLLGRVFATTGTLRALLSIVGALIGGSLGARIGLRPTIAVICVAYGLPFAYSLFAPFRTVRIRPEALPAAPLQDPANPVLTPPLGPPPDQTPP